MIDTDIFYLLGKKLPTLIRYITFVSFIGGQMGWIPVVVPAQIEGRLSHPIKGVYPATEMFDWAFQNGLNGVSDGFFSG